MMSLGNFENGGLLPHEVTYLQRAMYIAEAARKEALAAVGEANANSGGDWAYDDLTTQSAAHEAVLTDATYKQLKNLYDQGVNQPPIPYPAETEDTVMLGSRVTYKTPRWTETVDVVGHRIVGMPEDEAHEIEVVSIESPLGAALLGLVIGSQFSWTPDGRRQFDATVVAIDQTSQRQFYEDALGEQIHEM